MSFIAENPSSFAGKAVGTGQCVAFVETAAKTPNTSQWIAGTKVQGDTNIAPGTAIASFDPDGLYGNHTDGRSHAAIYMGQNGVGLQVWDQWLHQPVHQRTIYFRPAGNGLNVNNGTCFSVIEEKKTTTS